MSVWKAGSMFKGMSRAFGTVSRAGVGLSSAGGAVAGGVYGAFADDTSVVGGALAGAALGAGAWAGSRMGIHALGKYGAGRAAGLGRGKAMGEALSDIGFSSKRFFGANMGSNKAINEIPSAAKATKAAAASRKAVRAGGTGAPDLGVMVTGQRAMSMRQATIAQQGAEAGRRQQAAGELMNVATRGTYRQGGGNFGLAPMYPVQSKNFARNVKLGGLSSRGVNVRD